MCFGLCSGKPNRSFVGLQKNSEENIVRVPCKRILFQNKKRKGYLRNPIEEQSVIKPVHTRYLIGFYVYMPNFIDMILFCEHELYF